MAIQMTNDQFQQLLATIQAPQQAHPPHKSAAALGHMQPLDMGPDKMRKLKRFTEWLEDAENRMNYIGATTDEEKISLLRAWGGMELVNFMKLHAKVVFETIPAAGAAAEIPRDTYQQIIAKIKAELQGLVNRTLAMHELLTTKQGSRTWLEFYSDVEAKAQNLEFDTKPYTHKTAVKDALIMGMADKKLTERALAEDPDHDTLMKWGKAREAGKEGVHNLTGGYSSANRIEHLNDDMSENEIDDMMDTLSVMKIRKQGKYSSRPRRDPPQSAQVQHTNCRSCQTEHPQGRCPAYGKECFSCGGHNHFSRSEACPKSKRAVKRIQDQHEETSEDYAVTAMDLKEIKMVSIVGRLQTDSKSKEVTLKVGGVPQTLFTDTGSLLTIIPPTSYTNSMGKMIEADTKLRAWGSDTLLDVIGMVNTKLETEKGATTNTKVYIVDGFKPEPLLGDADAEALGFVTFNKDGREPTCEEEESTIKRNHCIPEKVRQGLNVSVITNRPEATTISKHWQDKTMQMVNSFKGLVFSEEKVGKLVCDPVSLPSDQSYKPTQPPFRNIPIHYQQKVSNLLKFFRENDVITDVDPKEINECVLNVVITDKANGAIRMNIDNTPINPGMQRTKYHIQTPQEIRHELKEAKVFTEMDMGWGFHHAELDKQAQKQAVFQTHEGIHRMKRLYFGPTAASGIFHNEIRKAFSGLQGITTLHDNILVTGRTEEEHYNNLHRCLVRCKEKGIILKLSKSTFCKDQIQWFGRTFTPYGVAADQHKINEIKQKGRPASTEEVRSLLMACQYNAKFAFDNPAIESSYEEITAPLRKLLRKNARFQWESEQESSYEKLMNIMTAETTLRPYDIDRKTHYVADASPLGIQASIYQEDEQGIWLPVDHLSRALTVTEQKYSPIEKESLAQSWGMDQFRFYLIGSTFTSWSDHKPLIPLYNNRQSAVSKRISRHRDQIQDLDYTMKHIPGNDNPCDFGSRHPLPIEHLEDADKTKLGLNMGNEIYVRKISTEDSPRAISMEDIKSAATNDPIYTKLAECIQQGNAGNKDTKEAGYHKIWRELCVIDGIIHKGNKIVIPDGEFYPGSGNIRTWVLDIAHEGHQGCTTMKRYLRSTAWFPGIDRAIDTKVSECLACQASTKTHHRDPLIPSKPPSRPWEKLSADHWGPLPDGKHLLVVIDDLSRYPEVAVVKGTSAHANIPALDDIFARHGFCRRLKTDGGPPFNGNENHSLQQYFRWAGIVHKTTVSAEDPEANGLAESFMKHCVKIYHTAMIEKKNPEAELNKHLRIYRATPHPTTGKPPALLLFGRNIRTRVPTSDDHLAIDHTRNHIQEARTHEAQQKQKQKQYKDDVTYVKPHQIREGDHILLAQIPTKAKPPYNPKPFTATEVVGHQITGTREDKVVTRDAQKWKKIQTGQHLNYGDVQLREQELLRQQNEVHQDQTVQQNHQANPVGDQADVDNHHNDAANVQDEDEADPPRLYPQRRRQRPDFYGDPVAYRVSREASGDYRTNRAALNIKKFRQVIKLRK